jgi:hypothetical protein
VNHPSTLAAVVLDYLKPALFWAAVDYHSVLVATFYSLLLYLMIFLLLVDLYDLQWIGWRPVVPHGERRSAMRNCASVALLLLWHRSAVQQWVASRCSTSTSGSAIFGCALISPWQSLVTLATVHGSVLWQIVALGLASGAVLWVFLYSSPLHVLVS